MLTGFSFVPHHAMIFFITETPRGPQGMFKYGNYKIRQKLVSAGMDLSFLITHYGKGWHQHYPLFLEIL